MLGTSRLTVDAIGFRRHRGPGRLVAEIVATVRPECAELDDRPPDPVCAWALRLRRPAWRDRVITTAVPSPKIVVASACRPLSPGHRCLVVRGRSQSPELGVHLEQGSTLGASRRRCRSHPFTSITRWCLLRVRPTAASSVPATAS